jgi:hypothetical protein
VAFALDVQPAHDRAKRLAIGQPVEILARVDEHAIARKRQRRLVGVLADRRDHAANRQIEGSREGVVTLVVSRHGHDRAGAVLHQDVVGDVHRDLLAVDRIRDGAPERHARLRLLGVAALLV